MSKLMDELYAEITRVNELQTEVDRTVQMHDKEIKASRDEKGEKVATFLCEIGVILRDVSKGERGYFPDIPLDVYHNGKQIYINYSVQDGTGHVSIYGGYRCQIQYRVYSRVGMRGKPAITWDYDKEQHKVDIINAIIDQWDDECEQKLGNRIANIVKKKMAERMDAMQKKLEDSNNEYENYFRKDGE